MAEERKKIGDLTAASSVVDTDKIEIESGIAGKSATFLTVWNWIKTKITNWDSALQYVSDIGGKLAYKGSVIDKAAAGNANQVQYNDAGLLNGADGYEYDKTNKVLKEYLPKLYRRVDVTTAAPAYIGTATGGTTTTLNDTTKTFTAISGKALLFTSGANQGQSRAIQSFTTTSITVTEAFPFAIAASDAYEVIQTTVLTNANLNSVYAFYVTQNHAVILPSVSPVINGSTNFYYAETVTAGKSLTFICAAGQTIDGVSPNPNFSAAREGVLHVAHNTASPHWDTLASVGLQAFATNCSSASFSVTTSQNVFQPLQNIVLNSAQRFIAPTGNVNRLQYTSIIPRTLPVVCVVNAKSDTANSQIFTLKLRKFTKSTGLTTDVDCAIGEITLNGAQDTSSITVIGNVSFAIGDQVWAEIKNDNAARNFTVIRSTTHVR